MTVPAPLLLHVYPTFDVGGAQMRFAHLANHFGSRYRHRVVAMNGGTAARALIRSDVDLDIVDLPVRRGDTLASVRLFRRTLAQLSPSLLVTSNWGSIEWAMANLDRRIPHVHMEDGFGPEEADRQLPRRVWTRRLFLRGSTVVLPSRKLFDIASRIWRLPPQRLLYVPNGVDCSRFQAGGAPPAEPIIGTVAALRAEKNLARLIDAFASVAAGRPARLVIVGDGPQMADLRQKVDELGLATRVTFTGNRHDPEVLLPTFSVFALSSDTEQMPLSVLEAMAAGLPVASTDVGDVRTMVSPENTPYIVAKESSALAGAIEGLLEHPDIAQSIGAANRRKAHAEFDQSQMFAAYGRLFDGEHGG
jgi:glycosyltransferase involved in cell wall biosynthesis